MAYCPHCRHPIENEKDNFCKRCGEPISDRTRKTDKDLARKIDKPCAFCDGQGEIALTASALDRATHRSDKCEVCGGLGKNFFPEEPQPCKRCNGKGKHWEGVTMPSFSPCDACGGKGWLVR